MLFAKRTALAALNTIVAASSVVASAILLAKGSHQRTPAGITRTVGIDARIAGYTTANDETGGLFTFTER